MNDQTTEQAIQAKGLTAPRVTPADIEAEIAVETYFTAAEGHLGAGNGNYGPAELRLLTFCVLVLRNGCKVVGINHGPVDPAGFDPEYGRQDAREDAIRKVWPLLGFRLRDKLAGITGDFSGHDIADAHRDSFAVVQSGAPRFSSVDDLAIWLESLHETNDDGAVTANKLEPAQVAAQAIRDMQQAERG